MPGGVAYVNSDARQIPLNNGEETVLRLGVGPGTYLVFGRVVVVNNDEDRQDVHARMTSKDGTGLIDSVSVRLPVALSSQTLGLQGTLIVRPRDTDVIDIRCETHNGFAGQSSLFTIEVSGLKFQP
jgi:hypothetical protein